MTITLLATTHRVAPGLLTWPAWERLRRSRVLTGSADHPQLPFLREAGITAEVLTADAAGEGDARTLARALLSEGGAPPGQGPDRPPPGGEKGGAPSYGETGRGRSGWGRGVEIVWLAAPEGDEELLRALGEMVVEMAEPPEIEVLHGSYDLPGARLLDLVSTMDALRTGCPWDAKQTHESLAPYLLEEAYEALEAVETGDLDALREELGDVLLQVVFHARVAQERADETGFTVDDVAAGIVDKLVRRHPHVFGGTEVSGAEEVTVNWDAIKAAERAEKRAAKARAAAARAEDEGRDGDEGRGGQESRGEEAEAPGGREGPAAGSVLDGVPFGQPALSLADALYRRAARAGAPDELLTGAGAERGEVAAALVTAVHRARELGVDPEAELRAAARRYRDRVHAWERGDSESD
jgi:XTP/dITP diphosphohydrolase